MDKPQTLNTIPPNTNLKVSDLKAPTTATMTNILVNNGDKVSAQQVIAVLEAMKLQIEIKSPITGTVSNLKQTIGELIEKDQVICHITAIGNKTDNTDNNAEAALKASRWLALCNQFTLPVLSLGDTPGFMVGPDSEEEGAVTIVKQLM